MFNPDELLKLRVAHERGYAFVEFLRRMPKKKFSFNNIIDPVFMRFINDSKPIDPNTVSNYQIDGYCGSVGCGIGWLPFWQQGHKDGWKIVGNQFYTYRVVSPYHKEGMDNIEATKKYFGISLDEVNDIFMDRSYYNKYKHIRKGGSVSPQLLALELKHALNRAVKKEASK